MRARLLLLPFLVLALIAPTCGGKDLGTEPAGQNIGAELGYNVIQFPVQERVAAPSWSGTDLHGAPIKSSDFDGSITVVNIWAAWCPPCRVEQPALVRVANAYASKGVRFLGIDIRETEVDALAHVEEFAVPYPSLFDQYSSVAHKFRIQNPPTTFVLDAEGRIAWKILGETKEADLSRILDTELSR